MSDNQLQPTTMTDRERFLRYTSFASVDRWPRWEWYFRADTTERWRDQGLPVDVPRQTSWIDYFGLDHGGPWIEDPLPVKVGVNLAPLPSFYGEVIEQTDNYTIRRDAWGATEKSLRRGVQSIPQYLGFPITDRASWLEYRKRLNPADPGRYPAKWEQHKAAWLNRDFPTTLYVPGWYGVLRKMMGVETLSVNFYDQPALVGEICEYWTDFVLQATAKLMDEAPVDYIMLWEDLAYKTGPLLSPEMFRHYMAPQYRRLIDHLRRKGVQHFMVDSDGNIDLITPLWLEVGVDMLGPYEVTAGMDVVKVAREYRELLIVGGIDKMELAKGTPAIEAEVLRRISPLLDRGGYFPTLDHSTIPELSLADYGYYRQFMAKVLGSR